MTIDTRALPLRIHAALREARLFPRPSMKAKANRAILAYESYVKSTDRLDWRSWLIRRGVGYRTVGYILAILEEEESNGQT